MAVHILLVQFWEFESMTFSPRFRTFSLGLGYGGQYIGHKAQCLQDSFYRDRSPFSLLGLTDTHLSNPPTTRPCSNSLSCSFSLSPSHYLTLFLLCSVIKNCSFIFRQIQFDPYAIHVRVSKVCSLSSSWMRLEDGFSDIFRFLWSAACDKTSKEETTSWHFFLP